MKVKIEFNTKTDAFADDFGFETRRILMQSSARIMNVVSGIPELSYCPYGEDNIFGDEGGFLSDSHRNAVGKIWIELNEKDVENVRKKNELR